MPSDSMVVEDDASIDAEEVEEYQDMVKQLGGFPDKVKINSLSMVAEDHAESMASAKIIYETVRKQLLSTTRENMLPLVYLLDSILKNAKGKYVEIMEQDAQKWMPTVHEKLPEPQRAKLERMWNTWREFSIFPDDCWKAMGRCFDKTAGNLTHTKVAGITRTKDGALLLSKALRAEMQSVLDELQSNVTDELDKVSLERLAEINPDLLAQIKETAQEYLQSGNIGVATSESYAPTALLPSFFAETRSQTVLDRSKAWDEHQWNHLEDTHEIVAKCQQLLMEHTSLDTRYTQREAIDMIQYLASTSTTASLLTGQLERIKNQADRKSDKRKLSFPGAGEIGIMVNGGAYHVDPSQFTNDGIKKQMPMVIAMLYEVGLPFLSSADGRRFKTQMELSQHLDALFRKNQIEKSIARTEERGWCTPDTEWTRNVAPSAIEAEVQENIRALQQSKAAINVEEDIFPADESRDRCAICGINFKMFFDNNEGTYMYANCREIEVLNDEVALDDSEDMLVHVSCWKGLGAPQLLTMDQVIENVSTR